MQRSIFCPLIQANPLSLRELFSLCLVLLLLPHFCQTLCLPFPRSWFFLWAFFPIHTVYVLNISVRPWHIISQLTGMFLYVKNANQMITSLSCKDTLLTMVTDWCQFVSQERPLFCLGKVTVGNLVTQKRDWPQGRWLQIPDSQTISALRVRVSGRLLKQRTGGAASFRKRVPIVQPQSPSSLEQPLPSTCSPSSSPSIHVFFPLPAEQFGPSALSVSSKITVLRFGVWMRGRQRHGAWVHLAVLPLPASHPAERSLGTLLLLLLFVSRCCCCCFSSCHLNEAPVESGGSWKEIKRFLTKGM